MSWLKTHPFWTLLILVLLLVLLSYVLFVVGGHGEGGLDLGPITPEKKP